MSAKSGLASPYQGFACVSFAALLAVLSWIGGPPASRYFHVAERYGTYETVAGPAKFSAAWLHLCTPLAGMFASLRRVDAPFGAARFGDTPAGGYALSVRHAAQAATLYDLYVSVGGSEHTPLRHLWIMQVGRESAYGPRCNA